MSNMQQNFNAGHAYGQTQAKAEDYMSSAKDSALEATNKVNGATRSAGEQAQERKEEAAGFLQQTGEQVKNMAQGAMNSVKQTLGMDKQ